MESSTLESHRSTRIRSEQNPRTQTRNHLTTRDGDGVNSEFLAIAESRAGNSLHVLVVRTLFAFHVTEEAIEFRRKVEMPPL